MFSSNVAFEELVLRSPKASLLIKPFLTLGGWQEEKCVYWKVSVGFATFVFSIKFRKSVMSLRYDS